MNPQAVLTRGPVGVARLILLTLAAVGFLAMHGLAATDPAGAHHSPMTVAAAPVADSPMTMQHVGDLDAASIAASMPVPGGTGEGHDMLAACVFVLLTVLAGVVLHALRGGLADVPPTPGRVPADASQRPRAPPRPIFLSLCVFRL